MLLKGDCIEVMKAMKPNSVDAIVTDPPYGLEFMGKDWDKLGLRWIGTPGKAKVGRNYPLQNPRCKKCGKLKRNLESHKCKCNQPEWDYRVAEYPQKMQLWHTQWLTEAYRVLKPGGSMLVMGGTRTSHRLACAIEDTGFIIKDTLMWIYGSGFPKAQDLGKMIDKRKGLKIENKSEFIGVSKLQDNTKTIKRYKACTECGKPLFGPDYCHCEWRTKSNNKWSGFKVGGIKPAYEPIIWAVKPPEGSYVDNVLRWGVGAVNVDETRIGTGQTKTTIKDLSQAHGNQWGKAGIKYPTQGYKDNPKGRFPANILLSHHPECVQVGMKKVKGSHLNHFCTGGNILNRGAMHKKGKTDPDGLETVESWDCHPDCAVRLLDEQSGERQSKWGKDAPDKISGNINFVGENRASQQQFKGDSGGASRFFYCAKASRGERNAGLEGMEEKEKATMEANKEGHFNQRCKVCGKWRHSGSPCKCENPVFYTPDDRPKAVATNNHPTVKPIKLFEWLIKLVTREGQIILDPFIGSGTTAIAAYNAGRKCIGIEKEGEYLEIAKRRTAHWRSRPRQLEMTGG